MVLVHLGMGFLIALSCSVVSYSFKCSNLEKNGSRLECFVLAVHDQAQLNHLGSCSSVLSFLTSFDFSLKCGTEVVSLSEIGLEGPCPVILQ